MVTMAQSAANWRNIDAHSPHEMNRTHSLTHLTSTQLLDLTGLVTASWCEAPDIL